MPRPKSKWPGFIIDTKKPASAKGVVRVVVTPMDGRKAVTTAKMERDFGRDRAIGLAVELLERAGAPADLLAQVRSL